MTLILRKVNDYKFAPYELIIDANEHHFYLCRFNITYYTDPKTKQKILYINHFEFVKYSKPVNYTTQKYVITKNYIAVISNAEIIPELMPEGPKSIRRRFFFLMVWEKIPFESDKPENLESIRLKNPEQYEEM